ncbi:MAG: AzlD domain-containing protein [Rubrivivax sp.]|jgi:branched-subunit amino acid transport protein|nr:AzlD domain-containing protein [Rubrivivax sp.]
MSLAWGLLAIAGLALLSVVTRGFFFLTERELPVPPALTQALRYAPLAALAAVVAPEIVMVKGQLIDTWRDPRLPAAAVGMAYYLWRRGILGTIVSGMAVFLALRLGAGW